MAYKNKLKEWREAATLSREHLAEKVGVSPVSIYRIEKGNQQPRPELLKELCLVFGKTSSEFYDDAFEIANVTEAEIGGRRIPILDFVQAGEFSVIAPNSDMEESLLTDLEPSANSFALRIRGRSMEPLFTQGDLVIIDPAIYPRAEDFVVAVDERGDATFKQYHDAGVNDDGRRVFELVPLNAAYPKWRSDRMQITIRGTMIEHRRPRRR